MTHPVLAAGVAVRHRRILLALAATTPGVVRGTTPPVGGFLPGDLVYFDAFSHVAIVLGPDRVIEAPHTGANVEISTLSAHPPIVGWIRYPPQLHGGTS